MDSILIRGLQLPCRIGCLPEERVLAQTLEVDLAIALRSNRAARSGKIEDTVCYKTVAEELRELSQKREWALIEQLAEDITMHILEGFPAAFSVELELRKFILPATKYVGLRILRSREHRAE